MPLFGCVEMFPELNFSLARKLGSEFIGTFILVYMAAAAPIANQSNVPYVSVMGNGAAAGLAVLVVVLSTGHISGAHINPAVTVAFAACRHFPWAHVLPYVAVQVLGSLSASFVLKAVYHPFMGGGATVPTVGLGYAFAHEFIVTFVLMFVIISVSTDTRAVGELAAVAISGTVLLNILVAGKTTGGSMNPARTLGPAIASNNFTGLWIYMVAPPLGAVLGAAAYTLIKLPDKLPNLVYNDSGDQNHRTSTRHEVEPI